MFQTVKSKPLARLALALAAFLVLAFAGCGAPAPQTSPEPGPQPDVARDHHHHEDLVEWSGVYDLEAGTYTLVFQASSHDPSIMIAFLDRADYQEEGDELAAHHEALHLMEAGPAPVAPGTSLEVISGACYNLALQPEGTAYELRVPGTGSYIVFTEHFAWEFEMQILGPEQKPVEPYDIREYTEPHAH